MKKNEDFKKPISQSKNLTPDQLKKAYFFWIQRNYAFEKVDQAVEHFLTVPWGHHKSLQGEWLKSARQALFLSTGFLAKKMQITRTGYLKFEKNEKAGNISLRNLHKAAEAMDCELVYAIRPKKQIRFSQVIWKKLVTEAIEHPWVHIKTGRNLQSQTQALAAIAKLKMLNPDFRKRQGWSKRKNTTNS